MQRHRVGFLLILLLLAASLTADSVQHSLVFQSLDQSIWGPGGTPPSMESRFYILNPNTVSWDVSTSGYPGYVGAFDSVAGADFGAGGRAKSSGAIGLWVDMKLKDLGSVDVTYPVTPRVDFPDANSFRAGDTVAITTSYTTNNGWQMETTSPQFAVELDATFRLYAEASGRLCVFACTNVAPVPVININPGEFNIFTVQPGSSVTTPPWLGLPASATIGVPNIQTVASLDGNGRSLVSGDSDRFISLTLDLAGIAFDAARMPIGPSFSTDDLPGFSISGIEFDYNIIRVEPTIRLSARQNFRFDPNLRLAMRFAKPLEHWVVSGGAIGPTSVGTLVEINAGDTVYVRYPSTDKQPTSVGPTFRLANTFSSATGFDLDETLHVSAGGIGIRIPSFTIIPEVCFGELGCTPALEAPEVSESLGPLYSHDEPLGAQDLGNIFSGSWEMQGFAPVMVDAFALDPENPIILIDQQTGAVRNLGGGRRQLAYAIDFSNGGDVKLSDVHVIADLASAFAAAHSFKVDQIIACAIAANPNFNGAADKQLLAAGASLDVNARARIILIVSVYPKPDPPLYTSTSMDDGSSPLNTFVTATDNSSVLLGPGVISNVADYVLFADHEVKLDSIANSFGHIGANDFIEVKNGNSAILAGDLRAARSIKVQGELTADYAFSGGVIDVVNKAKLNLSGNMKPYTHVPVYAVSAPQPATPLRGNVWVPDNVTDQLQPGNYGDVTINRGATLSLAAGTYWFAKLSVADNASLSVRGSSRSAVIHVIDPGEIRIGQKASVRGILNAPRANVTFEERSRLEGSAAAKSITLRAGASVSYHRDCDRLVDPDCDGSPSCGQ